MNSSDSRDVQLSKAFLRPERITIGGISIRGITLGTLDVARELNLSFMLGDGEGISDEEMQRQVTTLLWAQKCEVDELLDHMDKGAEHVAKQVRRFAHEVPVGMLSDFQSYLPKVKQDNDAAAFEAKPKEGQETDGPKA